MKVLLGFIIKEIYHIIRDKKTLLVMFGMPIAQLIIFGYAMRNDINNAKIGILDFSKDNSSIEITNKIFSSGYFVKGEDLNESEDINKAFKAGKINLAIVFENNFDRNLQKENNGKIQIIADASDPNSAQTLSRYAESIINDYILSLQQSAKIKPVIEVSFKMFYNPELESVYGFVPGLIAFILMLISALMTSITIVREKELGAMETLLVSPLSPVVIIIGKVAPYIILAFLDAMAILLCALFLFDVPFQGSFLLFIAETLLFIATALSLGIFISNITSSQQAALMISLAGLLMPTILLSGFIFKIESMPLPLQIFTHIIPAKWYLIIIRDIMLKGAPFEVFYKETLILVLMLLILILLSVKKFKSKLE